MNVSETIEKYAKKEIFIEVLADGYKTELVFAGGVMYLGKKMADG